MPAKTPEINRKYQKTWYDNHKAQKIELNRAKKKELREWLNEYKLGLKCEKCGENHPACLDFHHKDPTQKEVGIAVMVSQKGWSREKMLSELKKCIVLCANCHRKLHWDEEHPPVV